MASARDTHTARLLIRSVSIILAGTIGMVTQPPAAEAQKVGDLVVLTQRTTQKIESTAVGVLLPGRELVVEKVSGKWLWVKADRAGWIDRQSVTVVTRTGTVTTEATAAANVVTDPGATGPSGTLASLRGDSATATAMVIEDPQPVSKPPFEPPRPRRTRPRVGLSVTPHGIGLGVQVPRNRHSRRPRISIGFGFGFGGGRRGHGNHGH